MACFSHFLSHLQNKTVGTWSKMPSSDSPAALGIPCHIHWLMSGAGWPWRCGIIGKDIEQKQRSWKSLFCGTVRVCFWWAKGTLAHHQQGWCSFAKGWGGDALLASPEPEASPKTSSSPQTMSTSPPRAALLSARSLVCFYMLAIREKGQELKPSCSFRNTWAFGFQDNTRPH